MKKERMAYEAPITESLELRVEGMVCTSPGAKIQNWEDDGEPLGF